MGYCKKRTQVSRREHDRKQLTSCGTMARWTVERRNATPKTRRCRFEELEFFGTKWLRILQRTTGLCTTLTLYLSLLLGALSICLQLPSVAEKDQQFNRTGRWCIAEQVEACQRDTGTGREVDQSHYRLSLLFSAAVDETSRTRCCELLVIETCQGSSSCYC